MPSTLRWLGAGVTAVLTRTNTHEMAHASQHGERLCDETVGDFG
jgi:hypothetical protein